MKLHSTSGAAKMTMKVVKVGSETKVNVAITSDQMYPSVSALADGGWIEAWQSLTQDGGGYGVYQRRYDAQGVAVGGETLVNNVTADHQSSPNVTGILNGGWVVTWRSNLQDGSGYGIYQRVYNAQGVTTGPDILVNATTANEQQNPSVTSLSDGGWVVTWQSNLQDGSSNGIYLRRYTAAGTSSGGDMLVNATTANDQSNPSVTTLKNGGWVVTWQSNLQDGSGYGIYQRAYNAQGVTTGPDILVNVTTANEQQNPSVTALSDGGWVVTWQSNLQDGSGYGVYQRHYTSSGATVGPDILVNTSTGSDQQNPSVTALPNGGWVVSWMSHLQDGAGWGIYHRHYTSNGDQILTGGLEIATGTAADETLAVQSGSLNAGDQLMGGAGTDTLQILSSGTIDLTAPAILSGFEAVAGSVGNDTVIVNASRFDAFTSFDGGAGTDILQFLGSGTYDTRGKTFSGIEKIVLSGGGGAVTVDTVAIALLLRGSVEDHNSVTFAGGAFTTVERQQLFRQGIETIIDSSGAYTNQPPSLNGLNGDSATVADGDTVLIDRGGDATVVDPMGSLRFLEVRVGQNGNSSEDRFGISATHGVSLSGGVTPGSLVSVNGIIIGTITSSGSELQIAFNGNATGALTQQLVRSLTYTNINEVDPAGAPRSISVTLTDSTGAWATATTVVTVEQANDAPTIRGAAEAAQSVADDALIAPFSGATVVDADSPSLTVTIVLDDPTKGALFNLSGGSYNALAGIYTFNGSAAEITSALQALLFDPRDRFDVGSQETTTFSISISISISDGLAPIVTQVSNVTSTASNRAPTAITLTGTSIDEHAGEGAVIGTLGAVDPNGSQGLTFTLPNDGEGRFAIENGNLVLTHSELLEAVETKTYPIQVKVTDAAGASYVQGFTITLHAEDDAPTLTGVPATAQTVEDLQALSPFSAVTVTDVDSPVLTITVTLDDPAKGALLNLSGGSYDAQTGTYTLSGSASEITAALRALRFDPRDRPMALGQDETTTFTITVQDESSSDVSQTCTVISAVSNRAPTAITLSGTSIDEHAPKGAVIGLLGAVDPNGEQGFTYRLLDNAEGRFAIADGKLVVLNPQLLAAGRIEAYSIQVMVTDAGGASYVQDFAVTVNINHAPVATSQGNAASGDEDTTITGKVPAGTDADGDTLTYRLVAAVSGLTLAPDGCFSYKPEADFHGEVTFQYQVLDNHGDVSQPQIFTVHVNPVGDAPLAAPSGNRASGDEGAAISGKVPTGTDADGDKQLIYRLATDVEGLTFNSDGSFSYTPPAGFHGEVQFQYQVVDRHNMASEPQTFTLIIRDTTRPKDAVITVTGEEHGLDAAEATSSVAVAIAPDEGAHVVLARINGMDLALKGGIYSFDATKLQDGSYTVLVLTADDAGNQTITANTVTIDTMHPTAPGVTLVSDTGMAGDLISSNGALMLSGVEAGVSVMYSTDGGKVWNSSFMAIEGLNRVQVRQVDPAGNVSNTSSLTFTLDTTAPSNISLSTTNVLENTAAGTVIGLPSATDANGLSYSLAANGDADGRFMLVTHDGTTSLVIRDGVKLDYEQATSHMVTVRVTDAAGNSSTRSFTLGVGDVKAEKVVGAATSDVLEGGAGNDVLKGLDGGDTLKGGSGNDTLWGQKGKDVFAFDTKLGTYKTDRKVNFDTLKDFSVKDDSIWLDNAIFKKLGSGSPSKPKLLKKDFFKIGKATDKNDYVLYDKKTGVLSYDADGSGRGKAVEFAQLKKGLAPSYKDFFVI
jgi:Ca2+-binding RTX toxin-like protein